MLEIRHLTITRDRELRTLVEDFSLVLKPGDKAVLIGEEGNGKSTLLKWIYDPALIEDYAEAEGLRDAHGDILGYLPQELGEKEREMTAADYFAALPEFWDQPPLRLRQLERELGLPSDVWFREQRLGSFSGGEKVKLMMAAVLLRSPDILLLDEPSNDVDLETLEWLEELICKTDCAVLFISHDETLIRATANRVILLEQLQRKREARHTVANVPYEVFCRERMAGLEKQGQLHRQEQREEREALERFRRIHDRVEHEQESISRQDPSGGRLLKKKMASVKALERRYQREHEEMTARPEAEEAILIRFHDTGTVPPGKVLLDYHAPELRLPPLPGEGEGRLLARDLHLVLRGPEKVCIIGRNGAGKTTLLRRLLALLQTREDLRVAYMPQEYGELLDPAQTPVEYLAPSGKREETALMRTWLASLRFTAREMDHPASELSGGQRAKLLLLKLSVSGADVLVLDEPTRNFSPLSGPEVRALLRGFPGAILSVSHDRSYIREVCDRVLQLDAEGLHETDLIKKLQIDPLQKASPRL